MKFQGRIQELIFCELGGGRLPRSSIFRRKWTFVRTSCLRDLHKISPIFSKRSPFGAKICPFSNRFLDIFVSEKVKIQRLPKIAKNRKHLDLMGCDYTLSTPLRFPSLVVQFFSLNRLTNHWNYLEKFEWITHKHVYAKQETELISQSEKKVREKAHEIRK